MAADGAPLYDSQEASRWAVVVGVDEYKDPRISRLRGAVADAHGVANALRRDAQFRSQQVRVLTSAAPAVDKPTKAMILDAVIDLRRRKVNPGDLLVFFFAGHGVEIDGQRYLVTYDASYESEGALKSTALQASDLMQELALIGGAHQIVMIDACRSDPINPDRRLEHAATDAFESQFTLRASRDEKLRVTLLSSSQGEVAYEWREKNRGFFSYFIEQGLAGEARTRWGNVTVSSLIGYLNELVPRKVREQLGREQLPYSRWEGSGDLVLVEQARTAPAEAPASSRVLFGFVKDSADRPIPGAEVRLALSTEGTRGVTRSSAGSGQQTTVTNDKGFFRKEVPRDAIVTVTAGGSGELGPGSVISAPEDAGKTIVLFLPRSGPVASADANPARELATVAYRTFLVEEFDAAERAARSALEAEPRNALAQAVLANCLAVHGVNRRDQPKLTSAAKWAAAALEAQPQMGLAHNAMGLVFYGSRDLRRAQLEFTRAMELDPGLSVAAANLAQTYFELRQYPEAERAFKKAISARPEAAVPYNGLAQVVLAQGRPREAARAALMAISRYELQDDYLGSFYVNLAAALQQWGRAQAALEAVTRAKSLGVSTGDATILRIEKAATSQKR